MKPCRPSFVLNKNMRDQFKKKDKMLQMHQILPGRHIITIQRVILVLHIAI